MNESSGMDATYSESDLIARARKGDMTSANQLLSRYQRPLWGFLLSLLGHQADAEDALQETCLKALRGLSGYRDERKFKSWLFQIAYRESLTLRRRQKRAPVTTEDADELESLADAEPLATVRLESIEARQRLRACVERLPEAEREVVLLRLQRDIPFREIAEITGAPLNTVLGRMRNATLRLRSMMTEVQA